LGKKSRWERKDTRGLTVAADDVWNAENRGESIGSDMR